jgi:hypothetical protein
MMLRSWRDWQSHRRAELRRTRAKFRPALESLEDRMVLTLFGAPQVVDTLGHPGPVATGDFNGDGHLDLAVAEAPEGVTTGKLTVHLNNGTGTGFHAPPVGLPSYAIGKDPAGLVAADFNRDGRIDLAVVSNTDDNVNVLLGNGDGSFHPAAGGPFGTGSYGARSLVAGDFVGDGSLDLAIANLEGGNVSILKGDGHGSFSASAFLSGIGSPRSLATADFNGDGRQDLAVGTLPVPSHVQIFLRHPAGGFDRGDSLPIGADPFAVAAGDFNGDGLPDLVTANDESADVSVLLAKGGGHFQPAHDLDNVGLYPGSVVVADFNGDGKQDVVAGGDAGLSVQLGDGHGGFSPAAGSPFGSVGAKSFVLAGDFNGDGAPDLVETDSFNDQALVLLNHAGNRVTLVSSDPAPGYDQPVTFTATVSASVPGSGAPTGSVAFYDGATPLGTVALDPGGQARFTTTGLAAGNHRITAVYSGDGNFMPRASTALFESVDATGDVTAAVKVTLGRFRRTPGGGRQKVTLQNASGQALQGPLWLVLGGLGRGAGLRRRAGLSRAHAPLHSPFVAVPLPGGVLSPGASVAVLLRFASTVRVRYRPSVLAGSGTL